MHHDKQINSFECIKLVKCLKEYKVKFIRNSQPHRQQYSLVLDVSQDGSYELDDGDDAGTESDST